MAIASTGRIIMLVAVLILIAMAVTVYYYWFSSSLYDYIVATFDYNIKGIIYNSSLQNIYVKNARLYFINNSYDVMLYLNKTILNPITMEVGDTIIYDPIIDARELVVEIIGSSQSGSVNLTLLPYLYTRIEDNKYIVTPLVNVTVIGHDVYEKEHNVIGDGQSIVKLKALYIDLYISFKYYIFNKIYYNNNGYDEFMLGEGYYDIYFISNYSNKYMGVPVVHNSYFNPDEYDKIYSINISVLDTNYTVVDNIFKYAPDNLSNYDIVVLNVYVYIDRYTVDIHINSR